MTQIINTLRKKEKEEERALTEKEVTEELRIAVSTSIDALGLVGTAKALIQVFPPTKVKMALDIIRIEKGKYYGN